MTISTDLIGERGRRARLVVLVAALFFVGVAGGCTTDGPKTETTTTTTRSVSAPVSETPTATGTAYEVDDLGLRFELPANFTSAEDESLAFLARSLDPRAIFSIDRGSTNDTEVAARSGESRTPTTLGQVDAVLVTNASVDGLPPGISANELVVSNGAQSFSVIMSAAPADLAELWAPFVASVTVDPA